MLLNMIMSNFINISKKSVSFGKTNFKFITVQASWKF